MNWITFLRLLPLVAWVAISCSHTGKSSRTYRPEPTAPSTPQKVETSTKEIVLEQQKVASPELAITDDAQLFAFIEILLKQKKMALSDYDGQNVSMASYRLNPSQYFVLLSGGPSSNAYIALNTTIRRPSTYGGDDLEISHKIFNLSGDMSHFSGAMLESDAAPPLFAHVTDLFDDLKNSNAIARFIQSFDTMAQIPGTGEALFDLGNGSKSQTGGGKYQRGYLYAGVIFSSIASINYLQSHGAMAPSARIAQLSLRFIDWLTKWREPDAPVVMPQAAPRPVDLDDAITPSCTSYSDAVSSAQFAAYSPLMADAGHRFYHLMWHGLRNSWHELTDEEVNLVREVDPRYEVLRPLAAPSQFAKNDPAFDPSINGAGEDFLRMHRDMVLIVRQALIAKKLPCIAPWVTIPAPDDPTLPIVPVKGLGSKTQFGFQVMKALEENYFHNQKWLAARSLTSVANNLEFSLHGLFHLRFGDQSDQLKDRPYFTVASLFKYPRQYVSPDRQYLTDPYSSHVNPIFWRLHGYVDEVVQHWLVAHGYDAISKDCGGRPKCYQWQTGKSSYSLAHHDDMNQVLSKFQAYLQTHPAKAAVLDSLLRKIETNKVRIAGVYTTYPEITNETFDVMDRLGVSANFATRLGEMIMFP